MSSSIDFGTLAIGALVGIGCRKQLKASARIAATMAASLASATAVAVNEAAAQVSDDQTKSTQNGQKKDH